MTSDLENKDCQSCNGGTPPFRGNVLRQLQGQLGGDWHVVNQERLERQFKFDDFRQALAFTNKVGEIAEQQGHHPDIYLTYGEVRLQIWTHKIKGLTESDFILAAKVNEIR